MGDEKSLAHTRWNCKYHIVFAPKYRRQAFYGEKRRAVGSILRKLCEWKNVRILEAECCADHIHMLLEIPPKMSVSSFMGYLKGKSSLMLYEQFGDLKFKYRNREFYAEKRRAVGSILRKLCEWKNVRILEAECCADHIHMLLEIPPKMSVSSFMGYLKGKSSLMLYEQFGDLKFKYRNREFWCRGYYVDTVGKNTAKIQDYIKHQLEEDKMGEQLSIPYPGSPFTGRK
ncbi:IS200/IS605 family transposase [Salmonella enterica]|nr:IS200/IS605 family transposase [Salmonella enterica]